MVDDYGLAVLIAVIGLTFVNSVVMLGLTAYLAIVLRGLESTCRELRAFIRRRFTQTIDKI